MNNKSLLIVGAGSYGVVAYEIAISMQCFDRIAFADDERASAPNGIPVIGKISDLKALLEVFSDVIIAIGNPVIRLDLIEKVKNISGDSLTTLISPKAYVSESAIINEGTIIEPMAVVSSLCKIGVGCIVSSGAVLGHECICHDGSHININATVPPYKLVPQSTIIINS